MEEGIGNDGTLDLRPRRSVIFNRATEFDGAD